MEQYGIAKNALVTIWESPKQTKEKASKVTLSNISDEGLYGMGFAITGEEQEGYCRVKTFYDYPGYVQKTELQLVDLTELKKWEQSSLMVINGNYVDVLSVPAVQGVRLISLFKGSLVKVRAFDYETEGWAVVELLDGRIGFVRNQYLREKEFSQSGLWTGKLPQKVIVDETTFRKSLIQTVIEYLGTQYRWGGRSVAGIDCSGLVSESYLLNGILIYRDAKIVPGFPVYEISKESMNPGDMMYFPGHVAMYLGNGSYIHSTGKAGNSGVVFNSLNPKDWDYRADLAKSWCASGSIF